MNLTFKDISELYDKLRSISIKKLPFKISYAISKNMAGIEQENQIIESNRIKLIEMYADKDETGKAVINNGEYHISEEIQPAFANEYNEFMDTQTEVLKDISKINISEFDKLEDSRYDALSAADMTVLSFMISEEKIQ